MVWSTMAVGLSPSPPPLPGLPPQRPLPPVPPSCSLSWGEGRTEVTVPRPPLPAPPLGGRVEQMIVRRDGDDLLLVRQADHALLSGWLAAAWGAPPWQAPEPRDSTVLGARLHDLAWTSFDEALRRRPDGQPFAFTEVDRSTSTGFY